MKKILLSLAVAASLSQVYAAQPAQMQSSAQIKLSARAALFIHSRVKLNANDRGRSAMDIFRVKDGKIA
jgi:hypothetical protein